MALKQKDNPQVEQENLDRQRLSAAIGKSVLSALGQPGNFLTIQVRRVWEDHYRVNVIVGLDLASARVGHSYFLVADGGGDIIASAPKIIRQY